MACTSPPPAGANFFLYGTIKNSQSQTEGKPFFGKTGKTAAYRTNTQNETGIIGRYFTKNRLTINYQRNKILLYEGG
jgi:hypothetical protein